MRFAIAVHGTRGDVEPIVAIALELIRRGHNVKAAVPPNWMPYVTALGIPSSVAYGPNSQQQVESKFFNQWQSLKSLKDPKKLLR